MFREQNQITTLIREAYGVSSGKKKYEIIVTKKNYGGDGGDIWSDDTVVIR